MPCTAKGWARHLSGFIKIVSETQNIPRFPVDVRAFAIEYSKNVYSSDPIDSIQGAEFSKSFEGALVPDESRSKWTIIYNVNTRHDGRLNFTLAHELGHYLLHRQLISEIKYCSRDEMSQWHERENSIECEANEFAAHLLMPVEDVAKRLYNKSISRNLLINLAAIYDVSLTALALRIINLLKFPAMLVCGIDGFISWSWSNQYLMKHGIFYTKSQVSEIPKGSLAGMARHSGDDMKTHSEGVWLGGGRVTEILICHNNEYTLSLIQYDYLLKKSVAVIN